MTKTIIHVGLHKTASTYLQRQIFVQSKKRTLLTRPFTQHSKALNQLLLADDTLYSENLVRDELNKISSNAFLLSDEDYSGCLSPLQYINRSLVAERFAKLFPEAEIVLFLRDQRDFCVSAYSSYIKMPYGLYSFTKWVHKPNETYEYEDYLNNRNPRSLGSLQHNIHNFHFSLHGLLYTKAIALYERLFPRCHVFLYEELLSNPEETIARLSDICGEQFDVTPVSENVSMTPKDLVRTRRRNAINLIENRYVSGVLRRLNRHMPVFSTEDLKALSAQMIGDYFAEDNLLLRKQLNNVDWSLYAGKYV